MLLAERLAYGASAVIMASMVVSGAMFLRMIAARREEAAVSEGGVDTEEICTCESRVLTVATEVTAGLVVGQSGVTAGFALCWHKRR